MEIFLMKALSVDLLNALIMVIVFLASDETTPLMPDKPMQLLVVDKNNHFIIFHDCKCSVG